MKLESFKFQDGKAFRLPEYPEKPVDCDICVGHHGFCRPLDDCHYKRALRKYNAAIAQSLASAIEVAPEDGEKVKHYCFMQSPEVSILSASHLWQPENGKVYSAECEMETLVIECDDCKETHTHCFNKRCPYKNQVARLKPKEEIFPAANSHDMKEGLK